ncbi:pentapeptide repeat-containing protein [Streptomyces sp. NPDC087440]|uniref:pentapeptide repeat-containing protein n=1 Tax=Streptomyces sp. NPDC087440 TaxID=3365790 RepID=UPI0038199D60
MTATPKPRSAPDDRELRLWKVGRTLLLAFAAAVLVAGGIFTALVVLLDFTTLDTGTKLDAKTLFDLVKLSFGVVAGAGALVALVVAYRRQRVDEAGAHRESTRLHTERFSQAVDKLGSPSPAVRLGGIHALSGLADDAPRPELRQTCIDVLCAYLRLPYPPDPGNLPDLQPDNTPHTEEQREAHQAKQDRFRELREVRHTILRLIADHYRLPAEDDRRSWQGYNLDLTGVTIDRPVNFGGARFSGGIVNFGGARFSSGIVNFGGAEFSGGIVHFTGARFSSGIVHFGGAEFSGGIVNFGGARFSGGTVNFTVAQFSGGTVNFEGAQFSGGTVHFSGARFSGGTVDFDGARFSGSTVDFDGAGFSGGTVHFDRALGTVPLGLLGALGLPVPAMVALPSHWQPGAP